MKSTSITQPQPVMIEKTFDGKLQARLTENVVQTTETDAESGETVTRYEYDEYVYETDWSEDAEAQVRANPGKFLVVAKMAERTM